MLSTIYKWLAIAGAAVAGVFGIWFAGREMGKDSEAVEATQAKMKDVQAQANADVEAQGKATTIQVETIKRANDVATKVNAAAPGDASSELLKKWTRD